MVIAPVWSDLEVIVAPCDFTGSDIDVLSVRYEQLDGTVAHAGTMPVSPTVN